MNRKNMIAGIASLIIAMIFAIARFTRFEFSFSQAVLPTVYVYPAAFFALLGLLLIYLGLKPLWRS